MKPEKRREGLVVKELPEEILVYDLERHKAHCLNPAAAVVFKHSNGERSVAELARLLRREVRPSPGQARVPLARVPRGQAGHRVEGRGARRAAPDAVVGGGEPWPARARPPRAT